MNVAFVMGEDLIKMVMTLNLTAERNKEWGASSYGWRE